MYAFVFIEAVAKSLRRGKAPASLTGKAGELFNYSFPFAGSKPLDEAFPSSPAWEIIESEHPKGGLERLWSVGYDVNVLPQWKTLPQGRYRVEGNEPQKAARMLGAKYIITDQSLGWEGLTEITRIPSAEGKATVYRNESHLPRAWVAGDVINSGDNADDVLPEGFDPATQVLLYGPALNSSPISTSEWEVKIKSHRANRVEIGARLERPGYLVLADTYYPGWRATDNGATTDVLKANVAMRAVRLDAGKHEVVFSFRPLSLFVGIGVSFVGWLALLGLLIWEHKAAPVGKSPPWDNYRPVP